MGKIPAITAPDITALGCLATAETALADGTPGAVAYTKVYASAGYAQQLMLGPGFTVYRSPSASQYRQVITVQVFAWRWNGSNWGSIPVGSAQQSITTDPGQLARFSLPSIFVSDGYYTMTLAITWKYTNGAQIAYQPWYYNATSDYQCMPSNGTCYVGAGSPANVALFGV